MEESMSGKRKTYTKAFKLDAIAQVTQANQNVESVAKKLGIRAHLLSRWIRLHKQLGDKAFPGMGYSFSTDNQTTRIHELEAEVQRLRTENIILKKASIVFAREINLTV
jgi:transposase